MPDTVTNQIDDTQTEILPDVPRTPDASANHGQNGYEPYRKSSLNGHELSKQSSPNGHARNGESSPNGHARNGGLRGDVLPSDSRALNWCLAIGELVLRAPSTQGAQSPSEALERYVAGVDVRNVTNGTSEVFTRSEDVSGLSMAQRIDRLGMQIRRPRAEVIDWAVCIGVEVLSDPVSSRASSPPDCLAAYLLRCYVERRGGPSELEKSGASSGPTWHP